MCLISDLHSANVSRATDTILCRKAFFNLHLRRANCYVYLTNLFFLLTRSSYCVQQKQLSRLVIIYLTYYYRTRSSSLVKLRAHDRSDPPIIRHLLCACVFPNNIRRMLWCRLSRLIPANIPLKTANVEF